MKYVREGEVLGKRCRIGGELCYAGERVWKIEIGGVEVLHRENEPARICYDKNGEVMYEVYYLKGKKHRESGPGEIWYKGVNVIFEEYYLNGEYLFNGKDYSEGEILERFNRKLKEHWDKEIWG